MGIDPAPASIGVARRHAEETGARLAYRAATLEEVAAEPTRFDIVGAMEVVEHVADPASFAAVAASLLKPGGLFLSSTLNRTLKASRSPLWAQNICCAGSSPGPIAGSSS